MSAPRLVWSIIGSFSHSKFCMINILFVSTYLARNGTEAFIMNVFRNLDKSRFHVDFLCFSRKGIAYDKEITESGSSLTVLPPRRSGFRYLFALDAFFKRNAGKYEVIHWCACSCTSVAPLYFAYKYKIPVRIIHSHNSSVTGFHNKVLHRCLKSVANLMATTRIACSQKASDWFFGRRHSLVLTNGVQLSSFRYDYVVRQKVRKDLGISPSTKVLGHVGRFEPVKNHAKLVDIFSAFNKSEPDSILVLVGSGVLEQTIRIRVEEKGLKDKVLFLGVRNDVPKLMQAMDCFVMPSLFEGLPFVLVEAQASGLPCVVSSTIDENVKITDKLVFARLEGTAEEWSEQIESVIKTQRCDTSNQVRSAGFSIEQTVEVLSSVYESKSIKYEY